MSEHLGDLELDLARIDAASLPAQRAAHLEACARCQARGAVLTAEAAQFHERFSLPNLAAEALEQHRVTRASRWRWRWLAPAFATALALATIVVWPRVEPTTRTKGDAQLVEVFVLDGQERRALDGPVPARTQLAVRVTAEGRGFARVAWWSSARWTPLYPEADRSWAVDGPAWLERAIVLDDARGPEALGVIVCAAEISEREALEVLEASEPSPSDPSEASEASGPSEPSGVRADCRRETVRIEKR